MFSLLDFVLIPIATLAILFIYIFGFAHLKRKPFAISMFALNVLFLSILLPGYVSILLFSFKHGKGAGEYLFGFLNPTLYFILIFLYLLQKYRQSFVVYNLCPLKLREVLRKTFQEKGWKTEEGEEYIEVLHPRGKILIVSRWMGGVVVHVKGLEGEEFEGDFLRKIREVDVKPQVGTAIVNILLATFLLFYLMKILL